MPIIFQYQQSKSAFFGGEQSLGHLKTRFCGTRKKSIGKVFLTGILFGILPYRIHVQDKYWEINPSFCALKNHLKPPKTMLKLIFVTFITQLNQKCQFEHLWVYKGLNKKVKLGEPLIAKKSIDFGHYAGYQSDIQWFKTNFNFSKRLNGYIICLKVDIY